MDRKQVITLTNRALVPLFLLTAFTGLELHAAGHALGHDLWHGWAVSHTLFAGCFAAFAGLHVRLHRGWYKARRTKGVRSKSVWLLSVAFLAVVVTGGWLLLAVDGAGSGVGLLHYKGGLVASLLGVLHILKRRRFLYKEFSFLLPLSKHRHPKLLKKDVRR